MTSEGKIPGYWEWLPRMIRKSTAGSVSVQVTSWSPEAAQLDGVGQAVVGDLIALGQHGLGLVVAIEAKERLDDVADDVHSHKRRRGVRIETVRARRERDLQLVAILHILAGGSGATALGARTATAGEPEARHDAQGGGAGQKTATGDARLEKVVVH